MDLDPSSTKPIALRLKKAHGHLARVIAMLEGGAECEDVLTQLAAVTKALDRGGFALVAAGLQQCLEAEAAGEGDGVDMKRLERVFLALA